MSAKSTHILITGAAGGIGRQLVSVLAARGHHVWATGVGEESLSHAARQEGWPDSVRCAKLDVTDPSEWERMMARVVEREGPLDVLINNAGYLLPAWVEDIEPDEIDRHLQVNVRGVMLGTSAAARAMTERGSGHIINIASLAGLAPVPGNSVYSASKFAVRGFTLAVAEELRPKGVDVTCVMPDAVRTPMLDLQENYEEAAMTFSGSRPLAALEIAEAIADDVLRRRPLEIALPMQRGLMARVGGSMPGLSRHLLPVLQRRGLRNQRRGRNGG